MIVPSKYNPILGYSDIQEESLQKVVENLEETTQNMKQEYGNQNYIQNCKLFFENAKSFISANFYSNSSLLLQITCHISKIDKNNATLLELFISKLSDKLNSLSVPCSIAEIKFSKNAVPGNGLGWHLDAQTIFSRSIIISFSNKKNWSTRILNDHSYEEIFGGESPSKYFNGTSKPYIQNPENEELLDKVGNLSQSASLGYFYDALQVIHRIPCKKDLDSELIEHDYRLFIRFSNRFDYGFFDNA